MRVGQGAVRRRTSVCAALLATVVVLVAAVVVGADTTDAFLERHWRRPLAPQGPPPARYSAVEASLEPEACGGCHPLQLADWKTSLHARAMGPGVTGQLAEMLESDPETAVTCYGCHAPLAEQVPLVRTPGGFEKNPAYDPALRTRGVTCAACHVRAHERFGPPKRDGTLASPAARQTLPHNGATRTRAFLASDFCGSCHQFAAGDFALNGKLLEDTLNEWKASRFARDGVQCQDCHMPDRRHLWRGIHDPETVRRGITVTANTRAPRYRAGETVVATLAVENTGVGHAFPTYVTPRVVLRVEQVDARGRAVAGTRQERVIERSIALDLSRELSDTRLAPGRRAVLDYRAPLGSTASRARFSVVVYPDAFYTRFFETLLREGAGRGTPQIRQALADTRASVFTAFERDLPLR